MGAEAGIKAAFVIVLEVGVVVVAREEVGAEQKRGRGPRRRL